MIYETILKREPIHKGWSADQKYCVTTKDGERYLLRISSMDRYERKKQEFQHMQQVAELKIAMCMPIEFGTCEEGVYTIHSFINGVSMEDIIKDITEEKQYQYGVDAGKMLKKIHTIKAFEGIEDWEKRFNWKIDRNLNNYRNSGLQYDFMNYFVKYVNEHRSLLKGRPQCYQHGDFHIGNMMFDQNENLIIIDFDRDDYGDPWEEFNRIVWSAENSPAFASGMVDNYFDNEVPQEFWKLLLLYISSNTISGIPWAYQYDKDQLETMINQAKLVLKWYQNMETVIPAWYRKGIYFN